MQTNLDHIRKTTWFRLIGAISRDKNPNVWVEPKNKWPGCRKLWPDISTSSRTDARWGILLMATASGFTAVSNHWSTRTLTAVSRASSVSEPDCYHCSCAIVWWSYRWQKKGKKFSWSRYSVLLVVVSNSCSVLVIEKLLHFCCYHKSVCRKSIQDDLNSIAVTLYPRGAKLLWLHYFHKVEKSSGIWKNSVRRFICERPNQLSDSPNVSLVVLTSQNLSWTDVQRIHLPNSKSKDDVHIL